MEQTNKIKTLLLKQTGTLYEGFLYLRKLINKKLLIVWIVIRPEFLIFIGIIIRI